VTDPPSVAGARIRALGSAALAAGAIRRLGRVPRPRVPIDGIWYDAAAHSAEQRLSRATPRGTILLRFGAVSPIRWFGKQVGDGRLREGASLLGFALDSIADGPAKE
jgi:hypothetical protein